MSRVVARALQLMPWWVFSQEGYIAFHKDAKTLVTRNYFIILNIWLNALWIHFVTCNQFFLVDTYCGSDPFNYNNLDAGASDFRFSACGDVLKKKRKNTRKKKLSPRHKNNEVFKFSTPECMRAKYACIIRFKGNHRLCYQDGEGIQITKVFICKNHQFVILSRL